MKTVDTLTKDTFDANAREANQLAALKAAGLGTIKAFRLDDLRKMAKVGARMEEGFEKLVNPLQNPLSPEPEHVFLETYGDLTPAAANEMLAGLDNINHNFNHIYKALDTEYRVMGALRWSREVYQSRTLSQSRVNRQVVIATLDGSGIAP